MISNNVMKKQTSRLFRGVALLYAGFPFTFMTTAMILFDIPFKELPPLLIGFGFWLLSALSLGVAYGLLEVERWAWYAFLAVNSMISYYAASLAFNFGTSNYTPISLLIFLFIQLVLIFHVRREIRVPYFLPQIRWWESNPLLKISYPATLIRKSGNTENAEIMDFSDGGCFLKSAHAFLLDEEITIRSKLFGVSLDVEGHVIWKAKESVTHPKGIGVRFNLSHKKQKKTLLALDHRFKEIKKSFRRSRYLKSETEFHQTIRDLQLKPIKDIEKL